MMTETLKKSQKHSSRPIATPSESALPHATSTRPHPATAIDPAVAQNADFQYAQRHYCRPDQAACLGVTERKVQLLVCDLDDTIARLYAPIARLNLHYLKTIAQQNGVPFYQVAKRTTTLAIKNPDAVVHDPQQLVQTVFGAKVADTPTTQALLYQWNNDKRAAFTKGVDRSFASTLSHFKKGGSKIAILSNSPVTPLRERLYLIDHALHNQGLSLIPYIDMIACKPDPAGLTQRPETILSAAEHAFQTKLDQSNKLSVLDKATSKDAALHQIKAHLTAQHALTQPIQHIVQVGDRLSDITTAHKAGAQAVWITDKTLQGADKIAMRMVGESKVAESLSDTLRQIMERPQQPQRSTQTRPHAIIGSLGYLQQIYRPSAPI